MYLSVATNWDEKLLDNLHEINQQTPVNPVQEVFGSLQSGFFGSARTKRNLPAVTEDFAGSYIEKAHKYGIQFNYIFNSTTLGNRELTELGKKELKKYLDWLESIQVDIVTVTIPYLVEYIKDNYPSTRVNISTINEIDSLQKYNYFRDLDVSRITLSFFANRNFTFLKKLSALGHSEIELLANENCLFHCPYRQYHFNVSSFSSLEDTGVSENPIYAKYPTVSCTLQKLEILRNNISSPWIRPEDLHYYKELGFKWLKLSHRFMPTDWLTRAATAYANESYRGNLYDIIDPGSFDINKAYRYSSIFAKFADEEELERLKDFDIIVDNQKLDGFLDPIFTADLKHDDCNQCGYCDRIAQNAVICDEEKRLLLIRLLKRFKDNIIQP